MIDRLPLLALLVLASLPAGAASPGTRNYSVTGFDRVRLDGPYKLDVKTGVAPFARATGSPRALDALSIRVDGRTLVVRGNSAAGGYPGEPAGPVTIEVGTHELSTAWINGAGGLMIDRIKGLSFDLSIQGPGMAHVAHSDVDQLRVGISGAGSVRMAGKAAKMTATIRGTSSFDSQSMIVRDAVIGAEGPSIVRATVTNSAKVDAIGMAMVALTGQPACTAKARGSASITGCR
ncbi:GIN domain-containing protein [Sphingomonas xanthus]|nr:DUF2807 domain-containing protein [Sphingomonas xanthus]